MTNYPDDINNHVCKGCREIAHECVCEEIDDPDDESENWSSIDE